MARQRAPSVATTRLFTAIGIVAIAVMTAGCDLLPRPLPPTAADYCGIGVAEKDPDDIELTVWAPDARQHCLRFYAPVLAARQIDRINVTAVEHNVNEEPFRLLLANAASNQRAPDIAFVLNGPFIDQLAAEGYLHPLDTCNLPVTDWTNAIYPQRSWAQPFETEALMLFYSKTILRKLGWNESHIENLPREIYNQSITLDDLLLIARSAVDTGVVKKGFAFSTHEGRFYTTMHFYNLMKGNHDNSAALQKTTKAALTKTYGYYKLLRDQALMHPAISQGEFSNVTNRFSIRDALANGRLLFAHTVTSEWTRMLLDHVNNDTALKNNVGIALFPGDQKGGSFMLSAMGSYVIFSERATGKKNQDAACGVLHRIARSNLHRQHAVNTSQPAPEQSGIWSPPQLPALNLENMYYGYSPQAGFLDFVTQVNNITAALATSEISVNQAATQTERLMQAHTD